MTVICSYCKKIMGEKCAKCGGSAERSLPNKRHYSTDLGQMLSAILDFMANIAGVDSTYQCVNHNSILRWNRGEDSPSSHGVCDQCALLLSIRTDLDAIIKHFGIKS